MRGSIKARLCGAAAVVGISAAPAAAQLEGLTAISYEPDRQSISRAAAIDLGMTTTWRTTEAGFIAVLQSQAWDLVIFDVPGHDVVRKAEILAEFQAHLARGGRLMVNYPELDLWPELQELLGVRTVRDHAVPEAVVSPEPGNPIWGRPLRMNVTEDLWPDNGDSLRSAGGGFVAGHFEGLPLEAATVIRQDRLAIVNGFDWDSLASSFGTAQRQIVYLLTCRPDLEPDQNLDILDFLAFQNLWVSRDRRANVDFDGGFTIFDFLEYQNEFAGGCD